MAVCGPRRKSAYFKRPLSLDVPTSSTSKSGCFGNLKFESRPNNLPLLSSIPFRKKLTQKLWNQDREKDRFSEIAKHLNLNENELKKLLKERQSTNSDKEKHVVKNYEQELLQYLDFTDKKPTFSGKRHPASNLLPRSMFWPKLNSSLFLPVRPKFPTDRAVIVKTPRLLESSPMNMERLWTPDPSRQSSNYVYFRNLIRATSLFGSIIMQMPVNKKF